MRTNRIAQVGIVLTALCVASCELSVHDHIARGDLEAIQLALKEHPERLEAKNELGKTPLHYAITFAQPEAMEYLLEAGADVSAPDLTGLTPLHVAAIMDLRGAARLLVPAGASLEDRDHFGDTPLHTCAVYGSIRVLEYLIDQDAELGARNDLGLSPLELAETYGQSDAARLLREAIGLTK